jgi:2-hydroxychromene-2-carboxylate isomerase
VGLEVVEHRPDGGRDPARFWFELGSPACWLAAERILPTLPVVAEWVPAAFGAQADVDWAALAARAQELGLQPVRPPRAGPPDTAGIMRAATYAATLGKGVAFALAAFRQAYAGGRDLGDSATWLIAGAACEMHPRAILANAGRASIRAALAQSTAAARAAGAQRLPAIAAGERVFAGPGCVEAAATALGAPA